jgi:hypothetical protein
MKNLKLTVLGGLLIMMMAGMASADTNIQGSVYYPPSTAVTGATVTATCSDGNSGTATSTAGGTYLIQFFGTNCPAGNTVTVVATDTAGHTGTVTGNVAHDLLLDIAIVNVPISVPEFASAAVAVLISMGTMVFISVKRSRKN